MNRKGAFAGLQGSLGAWGKAVESTVPEALQASVARVRVKTLEQVPRDTGKLAASWFEELPKRSGGRFTIKVGYNCEYAFYVHENLAAFHAPPTKAHFLSDPIGEEASNLLDALKRAVQYGTDHARRRRSK